MKLFVQTKWWCVLLLISCTSCQKELPIIPFAFQVSNNVKDSIKTVTHSSSVDTTSFLSNSSFITYTILQGQQYCVGNTYPLYKTSAMHFVVKFDSSDIYTNQLASNQYDYNKLYGFSDNGSDHHSFSARFGWRWCHNRIELSAYTYNDSVRSITDLGGVTLNQEHHCSIIVAGSKYQFVLDGNTTTVPRTSKTSQAVGYKLLPYFGGDEMAPHNMTIQVKETK